MTADQPLRAAIYARVSTDEQVKDGTSLETQRSRCRAYIDMHGWVAAGEYVDEGVSGAKASRPRLDALMTAARADAVDVIVVAKLDRFGRSTRHLGNALGDLDEWGVGFVSIAESFDSSSPSGRLQRNMLGAFAEFEREQIRDRMMAGQRATAIGGHWPAGPPPFGYRIVPDGPRKALAVDDGEAECVRIATAVIVDEGGTVGDAVLRLNGLGYRPRRAPRWVRNGLRRRLRATHYAGTWRWRPATAEAVEIAIPPLMSKERMDQLHAALSAAPASYPRNLKRQTFYPLTGRIFGQCGAPYSGVFRNDRLIRDYRCRNRNVHAVERGDKCSDKAIHADDIEAVVWDAVTDLLSEPERLISMARDYLGLRSEQVGVELEQLSDLDRKISRQEEALSRAYADRYTCPHPKAMDGAIRQLEADLDGLREHRQALAAWQAENVAEGERMRRLCKLSETASTRLSSMSLEQQAAVYGLLGIRVTILDHGSRRAPAKLRVEGRLLDETLLTGALKDSGRGNSTTQDLPGRGFPDWRS